MSAARAPRATTRTRTWTAWAAGGVILALVATIAIVVSGFDSRETPREDPSVWVARSSGQYARVNTETAEIDTVRQVESPSAVVQAAGLSLLFTQGFGRAWTIDPRAPRDLQAAAPDPAALDEAEPGDAGQGDAAGAADSQGADAGAANTPDGTRQVIASGDRVLFHTEAGGAYLATVEQGDGGPSLGTPLRLDPLAGENAGRGQEAADRGYLADAAAIDSDGLVALYSAAEHAVRWFDSVSGQYRGGVDPVPDEVPTAGVQLAIVAGEWVLFSAESGRLWRAGGGSAELELTGEALLQGSSTGAGGDVLVADEAGLWSVGRDGAARRVADARGVPARPQQVGEMTAAWVGSAGAGLWTANAGYAQLELDGTVEDLSDPQPEILGNGSRALVAETRSGMLWTVPNGQLIPVEQWTLVDPPKQLQGEVVTQDVAEQEPPVAVGDSFGVRAGEPVLLPVLLNDYDPNRKDVLTVVAEGLGEGLPAEYGTLAPLSDGQGIMLHPSAAAQGAAGFSYRITDGIAVSEPATVTLDVVDDAVNSAPAWCPVVGCQRPWPAPEIAPGGTLVLPILEGWVDPEGDPMMLSAATPVGAADPVRTLVTADGRLAVRHTDQNAVDGDLAVTVRVSDARGASTERELRIRVRTSAAIEVPSIATTVQSAEPTVLYPLERVSGGSGSYQLVDAVVQ